MNMKKKIGPLEAWQWLAIAGGGVLLYYLYTRYTSSSSTAAATPAAAADTTGASGIDPSTGIPYADESGGGLGPIDPTTGVPYAIEGGYGSNATANQNSGPTSLQQELSDLQNIESLLGGLPVGTSGGANGTPAPTQVTITIAQKAQKAAKKAAHTVKKTAQGGHKTSKGAHGHTITHHPGGKQTAASTAPHNARQHKNVQPPAHQRAHPTKAIAELVGRPAQIARSLPNALPNAPHPSPARPRPAPRQPPPPPKPLPRSAFVQKGKRGY